MNALKAIGCRFIDSHKTTLTAMASAVLLAVYQGLSAGHLDCKAIGLAALAVLCGISRSPATKEHNT